MGTTAQTLGGMPGDRSLENVLRNFEPDAEARQPVSVQRALHIARHLQSRAMQLQVPAEKRQQRELERMMEMPHDKATLMQMTDQALRAKRPLRAADQLIHLFDVQGIPRFFSTLDRTLLKGFQSFGRYLPGVAVPVMREKMRDETANVILPAEADVLLPHLQARSAAGLRMNVNFLGEALLGEEAAEARLQTYLEALQKPEIECISVKISTIFSQISSLAWEDTVDVLSDRLELLYREAARMRYRRPDGTEIPKFVYLDMEEYRDMGVTAAAFMRTLDRPGLEQVGAGIALQAYLPDAWHVQREINAWARKRVVAGGAPVTIRLVKGANLEMEKVDASLHGWALAPYASKLEVDANYRRMLHEAMEPANLTAVRIGLASHNLFELAYGLVLAWERNALDKIQFEMLEGMANHQRRALTELAGDMLLYAPATRREHFIHAIGYLVRRLDENTGPDNFLRHAFKLEVGTEQWRDLESQFLAAFDLIPDLNALPRRRQDRNKPVAQPAPAEPRLEDFQNEPDTDFALPRNLQWGRDLIAEWEVRTQVPVEIPLVVGGEEIRDGRTSKDCLDPSRPNVVVARYMEASQEDLDTAIATATADPKGWRTMVPRDRADLLAKVAAELRSARSTLMGVALADGGKTLLESDPEVSEAVDFVDYYRRAALYFQTRAGVEAEPKGVVAVIPPWNFPIAIPCGGIAAALAAGNCVILKPASDTVYTAYELCRVFWRAGVPREVLQFMPCAGSGVGARLAAHPSVDAVILTGGTDTALKMLAARPDMNLLAETGGKDATIVTAMADRDQAIKNILHSAFGHSGQKCSATSLLILEAEVYEDAEFRNTLCDAVRSLAVGSAWDRRTRVGPLIRPPAGVLERGLKELDPGESWAVMPKRVGSNPGLWSPGVKWGVSPGSFMHMTELFGPVLAVMKATDLEHAIDLVNQTGYGLTSGLESLDDREQALWQSRIRAGNLYINRPTTGAIVLRQPFGGMGKSAFGPGIKAGGPNYVAQFMDFSEAKEVTGTPECKDSLLAALLGELRLEAESTREVTVSDCTRLGCAVASFERAMDEEFGREHDHFRLVGQDNIRRYRPVGEVYVRVHPDDELFDIFARVAATRCTGSRAIVSCDPDSIHRAVSLLEKITDAWGGAIEFVYQSDAQLAQALCGGRARRVRYAAPDRISAEVLAAAAKPGVHIAGATVLGHGRIELLWYLLEQSLSDSYHRYGNLGEHGGEGRAAVL